MTWYSAYLMEATPGRPVSSGSMCFTDKATELCQAHDCPKSKATEEEPGCKPRESGFRDWTQPSTPAASLTADTWRGKGHPAVPPCRLEMPLQGPRVVSPRTRIRTQTSSTFHSPQPLLPSPYLLFAAEVLPQVRLS